MLMKQVCITEPGKVEINQVEVPKVGENEALIRIKYGGICGSDLNTYKGSFVYASYPRVPGHESASEVIEVNDPSGRIKKGMFVTMNPYYNCGHCYSCTRGFVNCCEDNQTLGAQRDGMFQEYFVVPVERLYDSKGLDLKKLALVEPFCISYHAVKRGHIKAGENVLVVGAGTIGIFAAIAAMDCGANVYISDVQQSRLDLAKSFGVKGIINSSEVNLQDEVLRITKGNGFDCAIECVGFPSTFMDCFDACAFRGRLVLVGIGKQRLDFDYTKIQTKELDIFGSRNALPDDFREVIDKFLDDKYEVDRIISDVRNIDEAESAFVDLSKNPGEFLKILINFN